MLFEKLKEYSQSGDYPFHMPGHKRNFDIFNLNPYSVDITEIEGFDNLHNPKEILKDAMDRAAKVYKSGKSYFLVNGSSCGILAAISAALKPGEEILVARNCHKSVYNAINLRGLKPRYIIPKALTDWGINGEISRENVEKTLKENKNLKAVLITSPTYEGIVSDIKGIAEVCHNQGVLLIVDQAHGAHFNYCEKFPTSALELGADLVIESLHKTLPSLTQTAILHINKNSMRLEEKLDYWLSLYQSSSPSYILIAAIDGCIEWCSSNKDEFLKYAKELENLRASIKSCLGNEDACGLRLLEGQGYDYDISKIVISCAGSGISGPQLFSRLKQSGLVLEMAGTDYVIAMTSVRDRKEGYDRLRQTLVEIAKELKSANYNKNIDENIIKSDKIKMAYSDKAFKDITPKVVKSPQEAMESDNQTVKLEAAEGRISADFAYVYPPGIPIIAPGEEITRAAIGVLEKAKAAGLKIEGLQGEDSIRVLI